MTTVATHARTDNIRRPRHKGQRRQARELANQLLRVLDSIRELAAATGWDRVGLARDLDAKAAALAELLAVSVAPSKPDVPEASPSTTP